jgi:hypothetical protein
LRRLRVGEEKKSIATSKIKQFHVKYVISVTGYTQVKKCLESASELLLMYSPDVCKRREAIRSLAKLGRTMAVHETSVDTLVSVAPAQMKYEQHIAELSRACKDLDDGCRAAALSALAALAPLGDPIAVSIALVGESNSVPRVKYSIAKCDLSTKLKSLCSVFISAIFKIPVSLFESQR